VLKRRSLFIGPVGGTFRLLDVTTRSGKPPPPNARPEQLVAHVISMDDPKALPRQWVYSDIRSLTPLPEDKLQFKPALKTRPTKTNDADIKSAEPTPAEKVRRERWAAIEPLVTDPLIYFRAHRGRLVKEAVATSGLSDRTLMHALRLYWQGGMTSDALAGAFHLCGPRSDALERAKSAVGRKPKGNRYKKFVWDPRLKKEIIADIVKWYMKSRLRTIARCHRRVIRKYFSIGTGRSAVPLPRGEAPTPAQTRYLIQSNITLEMSLRRQHGNDNFKNNVAPKVKSAKKHAAYVGRYFELDATIPDAKICDPQDRSVIIGKATLYIVIDAKSMLILGFHLCIDNPSWDVAKEALLSISQDKKELCEKWGVEYREADWPAHNAWMQVLRVDRGPELAGYDSNRIADGLEGIIENSPPRSPTLKPFAELSFKLLHQTIRSVIGGYTPPEDRGARQVEDLGKGATRTLKELGGEILRAIIRWNHTAPKAEKADATLAELKGGFKATPIEVWKRDVAEHAGLMISFEHDYLRFKLLPESDEFLVRPSGIYYKNIRWVPPASQTAKWLLPATQKSYYVTASFRRGLVDCIHVHDPKDPTKWTNMSLAESHEILRGMTFAQAELRSNELLEINDQLEHYNLTKDIRYDAAAEERETEASKLRRRADIAKKQRGRSKVDTVQRRAALAKDERRSQKVPPSNHRAEDAAERQPEAEPANAANTPSRPQVQSSRNNALMNALLGLDDETNN